MDRARRDQDYLKSLEIYEQVYRDGVESPRSVFCSFTSSIPDSPNKTRAGALRQPVRQMPCEGVSEGVETAGPPGGDQD